MESPHYPKPHLQKRLLELGLPKNKQQLVSLKNILATCLNPWAVSNLQDIDEVAEIVIYLAQKNIVLIEKT